MNTALFILGILEILIGGYGLVTDNSFLWEVIALICLIIGVWNIYTWCIK